jgi:hypothetical protein
VKLLRPEAAALGLALSWPNLWSAFVDGTSSVTLALLRYLVAVLISAAALGAVRALTASYARSAAQAQAPVAAEAGRRHEDLNRPG